MSYYDSTVASFDSQISNYYSQIENLKAQIKKNEDDIEDLRTLHSRIGKVNEAVETATSKTSSKINNLPSVITNPFSFLKLNYFTSFLDVLKSSSERVKSTNSISSAFDKISVKIRDLENEIQSLRNNINQCNSNITSINHQRSSYISGVIKRKIEEENAAKEAIKKAAEAAKKSPAMINKGTNISKATNTVKKVIKKK